MAWRVIAPGPGNKPVCGLSDDGVWVYCWAASLMTKLASEPWWLAPRRSQVLAECTPDLIQMDTGNHETSSVILVVNALLLFRHYSSTFLITFCLQQRCVTSSVSDIRSRCPAVAQIEPAALSVFNKNSFYLDVVYKTHFNAGGNFAGFHAEGKHVIQVGRHVCLATFPLSTLTVTRLSLRAACSGLWWKVCELQLPASELT